MSIGLIWAQSANGVIGLDGGLPWRLPEDLAHFRRTTSGSTVLMGRRTWDSLPPKFRPLPGRRNLVLTRQPHWTGEGAETVHLVEDALDGADDVWVIGGAEVYAATLPFADRLSVTELEAEFSGDVHAPGLNADWHAETDPPWLESSTGLRYRILSYVRTR